MGVNPSSKPPCQLGRKTASPEPDRRCRAGDREELLTGALPYFQITKKNPPLAFWYAMCVDCNRLRTRRMSPCPKRITASTPSGVMVTLDGKNGTGTHAKAREGGHDLVSAARVQEGLRYTTQPRQRLDLGTPSPRGTLVFFGGAPDARLNDRYQPRAGSERYAEVNLRASPTLQQHHHHHHHQATHTNTHTHT